MVSTLIYIICWTLMIGVSLVKSYEVITKEKIIINEINNWSTNKMFRIVLNIWMAVPILNLVPIWYLGGKLIFR